MFGRKKKKQGEIIKFQISGMYCASCSISIDGELEDLNGVVRADTSYAKSVTKIKYEPEKVTVEKMKQIIEGLGYEVEVVRN